MTEPRGVLVTRPEPGLTETIRAVEAAGFTAIRSPLLTLRPLRPPLAPAIAALIQAVLLTSGQAADPLAALCPALLGYRVLAVGDATAQRARDAGFGSVESASGDAPALASLAIRLLRPQDGPLLLACGQGQGITLARVLTGAGFEVIRHCVYVAEPVDALPPAAIEAVRAQSLRAALFFSAETAIVFARVLPSALLPDLGGTRALAISPAAAAPLRNLGWQCVETAATPTAASILSLLGQRRQR